jgi:hypothetical protein
LAIEIVLDIYKEPRKERKSQLEKITSSFSLILTSTADKERDLSYGD